jgi:hypothetical protein
MKDQAEFLSKLSGAGGAPQIIEQNEARGWLDLPEHADGSGSRRDRREECATTTRCLKYSPARPPEMPEVAHSADWQFETRALADDFARFEVKALATGTPTISIFDYIGDDGAGGGVPAAKVAGALRSIGNQPVIVEINSPGGNYFEGVAIYNLLRVTRRP